jgi:hypothetical protein
MSAAALEGKTPTPNIDRLAAQGMRFTSAPFSRRDRCFRGGRAF